MFLFIIYNYSENQKTEKSKTTFKQFLKCIQCCYKANSYGLCTTAVCQVRQVQIGQFSCFPFAQWFSLYFTGKLMEFYNTRGSLDQFCLQNIQNVARKVLNWMVVLLVKKAVKYEIGWLFC